MPKKVRTISSSKAKKFSRGSISDKARKRMEEMKKRGERIKAERAGQAPPQKSEKIKGGAIRKSEYGKTPYLQNRYNRQLSGDQVSNQKVAPKQPDTRATRPTGKKGGAIRESEYGKVPYLKSRYGKQLETEPTTPVGADEGAKKISAKEKRELLMADAQKRSQEYLLQRQKMEQELASASTKSAQVADTGQQMQQQAPQINQLVGDLNTQQAGLGDQVDKTLQNLSSSGAQIDLNQGTLNQIGEIAKTTPPDQVQQKVNTLVDSVQAEPAQTPLEVPPPTEYVPPSQQYQTLKNSGATAAQIINQQPELSKVVKPDGTIINPNAGSQLIKTATGEAYKSPSGLIVPRSTTTGFPDYKAMTPDQISKLSYSDVLGIQMSTQFASLNLQNFYTGSTLKMMAERNVREMNVAMNQMNASFLKEENRINESKIQDIQNLELEKQRQMLSKDTTMKNLQEAKSKSLNIAKAQMDAWGLEGSSAFIAEMGGMQLKFEQEASQLTQQFDLNLKELALATTNVNMQYTNRITELNMDKMSSLTALDNEFKNKRDEIEKSVLSSLVEQESQKQAIYADYVTKEYEAEQQAQASAAQAEAEAQKEMWERQKWYADKTGMIVGVDENGEPVPVLDENGEPMQTLEAKKFAMQQDLSERQFQFGQQKWGAEFEFGQEKFGAEFGLKSAEFDFAQSKFAADYSLEEQKYWASLNNLEEIKWDPKTGEYIGSSPQGEVSLGTFGIPTPPGKRFAYEVQPDGIRIDVQDGVVLQKRGECGMFVNDILWPRPPGGGVGNSFASKKNKSNSYYSDGTPKPVAGGAFFEDLKPGSQQKGTGHVGMVERVNPDGSFDIVESNYAGRWKISRTTIKPGSKRWNTIVNSGGFYDPAPSAPRGAETGLYEKFRKKAIDDGMSGKEAKEFAKKQYESSYADMTESESGSYNAYTGANLAGKNYDSIIDNLKTDEDVEAFADDINIFSKKLLKSDKVFQQQVANANVSPEVRRALLNEGRWVASILRQESGAAITMEEYASMGYQYFPRKGDTLQDIQEKKEARMIKERAMFAGMGASGQRQYMEAQKDDAAALDWDVDLYGGGDSSASEAYNLIFG